MIIFCGEPSLLAPIEEWRAYLRRAESLGDEWTAAYARQTIALKERAAAGELPPP
jgi:hypothetical protein